MNAPEARKEEQPTPGKHARHLQEKAGPAGKWMESDKKVQCHVRIWMGVPF